IKKARVPTTSDLHSSTAHRTVASARGEVRSFVSAMSDALQDAMPSIPRYMQNELKALTGRLAIIDQAYSSGLSAVDDPDDVAHRLALRQITKAGSDAYEWLGDFREIIGNRIHSLRVGAPEFGHQPEPPTR